MCLMEIDLIANISKLLLVGPPPEKQDRLFETHINKQAPTVQAHVLVSDIEQRTRR